MEAQTRILFVDDEPSVTKPLGEFLQREGYRVTVALNGQDALEQLPVFHPHLIVLDIRMPKMDGREVLRRLRAYGDTVPILMLTEVTGGSWHRRSTT